MLHLTLLELGLVLLVCLELMFKEEVGLEVPELQDSLEMEILEVLLLQELLLIMVVLELREMQELQVEEVVEEDLPPQTSAYHPQVHSHITLLPEVLDNQGPPQLEQGDLVVLLPALLDKVALLATPDLLERQDKSILRLMAVQDSSILEISEVREQLDNHQLRLE